MKMRRKRLLAYLLAAALCLPGMVAPAFAAGEEENSVSPLVTEAPASVPINVALGKSVTASESENGTSYTPDKVVDGIINRDAAKGQSRWGTNRDPVDPWIMVDLGAEYEVQSLTLEWERNNITAFEVLMGTSPDGLTAAKTFTSAPESLTQEIVLDTPLSARYVKLHFTTVTPGTINWASVSIYEIKVYAVASTPPIIAESGTNLALNKVATASSQEADSVRPALAVDGNETAKNSRWGSAVGGRPAWLQVDLGGEYQVQRFRIFWERLTAKRHSIQVSSDGKNWDTVYTQNTLIDNVRESVLLDAPTNARFVRLNIPDFLSQDEAGLTANWDTISVYEFEVYPDDANIVDLEDAIDGLTASVQDGRLVWNGAPENCTISFGANYEQVVDSDGTVYQPLVDTRVELDVTVMDDTSGKTASTAADRPKTVVIPGIHTANEGNAKPAVIPELAEWYSSAAQRGRVYSLTEGSRIVAGTVLNDTAKELQADIKDLFGFEPQIVADDAQAGDIVLAIGSGESVAGFDDETYLMEVTDKVTITATDPVGAYWGTRSVLQALKLSGDARTIAQGTARDYPEFRLRGFMLDVGRKPLSMDMLRQIGKNMAWYKLNDFHVHVSDNLIFMEDYGNSDSDKSYKNAYSAFRLQSDTPNLQAKDYHYTKQEFKDFVGDLRKIGVEVVPEIDVPAHAKALTDAFPAYQLDKVGTFSGTTRPWVDHFDLTNHYDDSLRAVQGVFDEYIDSDVFDNIVHFGADEYYDDRNQYAPFVKAMIDYVKGKGQTARVWGSLSIMGNAGNAITKDVASGVQMDIWNTGWANPQAMYDMGFDLINITDGPCYIVPSGRGNRGAYGDYLNLTAVYNWTPNNIGGTVLPASSSQVLGGSYALWQDNIDTHAAGIDETDTFNRFYDALAPFSVKMWGEGGDGLDRSLSEVQADAKTTGYAPNTNPTGAVEQKTGTSGYFSYDFADTQDASGNERGLTLSGATLENGALKLTGGESYAQTPVENLGWNNQLTFRVKKTPGGPLEQVIFEGDHAYGAYDIKAIRANEDATTWKLGFSRELYDYVWDTELPENEWVKLTIETGDGTAKLYVNDSATPVDAVGSFLPDENSNTQFKGKTGVTHASFRLPTARIGSKTNAFIGLVDDVAAFPASVGTPLDEGKYDIPISGYQSASAGSTHTGEEAGKAIDGDSGTLWHSDWDGCTEKDGWIQLELKEKTTVSGLRYLPRSSDGENGIIKTFDILVSDDGNQWIPVLENGAFSGMRGWQTAAFPAVKTKFVRLLAHDVVSDRPSTRFVSAAELRICRAPDLSGATVAFAKPSYPLQNGAATPKPTVTLDDKLLTLDTDYMLSYTGNTAEGTATVTVTGKGAYIGSKTVAFTVAGQENGHTVRFDSNGGTPVQNVTVEDGNRIARPADPTKDGYAFVGWYKDAALTNVWDFETDTVTDDVTLYAKWKTVSSGGSSSGGSSSGGSHSSNTTTTTTTKPDGSKVTTTVNKSTGETTVTTASPDGVKVQMVTKGDTVVDASVTIPKDAIEASTVELPAELPTTDDQHKAPAIKIKLPQGTDAVKVEVPVDGLTDGTVAVLVKPDGTEQVIRRSVTEDGKLVVPLDGSATVKIVDKGASFRDVPQDSWAAGPIAYATSRELFKGMGNGRFGPDAAMTRAMMASVLYRFYGEPAPSTSVRYSDVETDRYYADAVAWLSEQGIVSGANGKYLPEESVTREQLMAMLYRAAGSPAIKQGGLDRFADGQAVSAWARDAAAWAVDNGIVKGVSGNRLAPQKAVSRAEAAAMLQRFARL